MNSIQKHLLKSTYRKHSRPIKIIGLNHGLNKTRPYVKRSYFIRKCNIFRKGFDSHMRKEIILQLKNVNKLKGRYTRGVLLPEHARGSFCTCQYTRGSVFKFAQFAPGACSQIFNRLNIVEHFAGWKFCSRGWSIPMKSLVHTGELCSRSVPLEHDPGANSLVCIGLKVIFALSRIVEMLRR